MIEDKQLIRDMQDLLERPQFLRFLFAVIQRAGLFTSPQTDGSVGRDHYVGRRSLGLEILELAELGQPIPEVHSAGPLLTLIQVLREETLKPPTEKQNAQGRSSQYNRSDELRDPDDDEDVAD